VLPELPWILVGGRLETAPKASVIHSRHGGHAADRDAEGAVRLQPELCRIKRGLLFTGAKSN